MTRKADCDVESEEVPRLQHGDKSKVEVCFTNWTHLSDSFLEKEGANGKTREIMDRPRAGEYSMIMLHVQPWSTMDIDPFRTLPGATFATFLPFYN